MALVEKRPGAPSGTFTVTLAFGQYTFDDASNTQVNISNPDDLTSAAGHPWLRLVGGTAVVTPTEVEHYTYDGNGRVLTMLREGVLVNFAYNSDGTIRSLTYPDGTVDTFVYTGGAVTSITTT